MSDHGDHVNDTSLAALITYWRSRVNMGTRSNLDLKAYRETLEAFERLFELGGFDALREGNAIAPKRHDGTPSQPGDWFEDFRGENGNYQCECLDCGVHFIGYKRRVICKVCAINKLAGIKTFRVDTSNTTPEHRQGFEQCIRQMGDINEKLHGQLSQERIAHNELKRQFDEQGRALVKMMHEAAIEARALRTTLCTLHCGHAWAALTDLHDKRVAPWIDFANDDPVHIKYKIGMRQASWKTRALLRLQSISALNAVTRFFARMVASNRAA